MAKARRLNSPKTTPETWFTRLKLPLKTIACLIVFSFLSACGSSDEDKIQEEDVRPGQIALRINDDFVKIRQEVSALAQMITGLYAPETMEKNLQAATPGMYRLHDNGVFYKPVDDGKTAVFVSGVIPVNDAIKKIVYATEPMDMVLMDIVGKYPEVVQAYYNDKHSYNRIFPYFDVISQYEPKMDIPSFNFYYLADARHNPEKGAVWVKEPYVDPAGRGWMVSAIAPVYVNGKLEGVPGLDITIDTITSRYIDQENADLVLLDGSGTVVSIQDHLTNLLSLPALENHRYLDTIRMDTYRTEDFNLLKSRSREVRAMAERIFKQNQSKTSFQRGDETFVVRTVSIPELDWKLLQIVH